MITCVEVEVPKDFSSANDYLSRALVASASLLVRTPVSLCCCSALNFLLRRDCSAGAVANRVSFSSPKQPVIYQSGEEDP